MKALRPSWGALLPPTPQSHAPHQPGPPTALRRIPTLACLSFSTNSAQIAVHPGPSALPPGPRSEVAFLKSQSPTATTSGKPWVLLLRPSTTCSTPSQQSPLVLYLSPNREKNRNFEPPPRWGGSGQRLARCPSLGASEGHTVARHSCPSSPHGGPEPRPLCQGLRNSGWCQGPLPVSFLLPPFQVVSLAEY